MDNSKNESIDLRIKGLAEELHIRPEIRDETDLDKKIRNSRLVRRVYLILGILILLGSVVLMFSSLMMEGKTWYKIEFSRTLFFTGMCINLTALVFILAGELKLRAFKIGMMKFLLEIKNTEQ